MNNYKLEKLGLGIKLIISSKFRDSRGTIINGYDRNEFEKFGIKENFTQQLISESKYGVLRGIHFQKYPNFQSKLIICLQGRVFIVVVDARKKSKTYGRWISTSLLKGDGKAIYIPKGLAVGFEVISKENAVILYNISGNYMPNKATGIRWDSKLLEIKWPMAPKIVSRKDANLPKLDKA